MSPTRIPFPSEATRQRAFTVIELLATIAVIGILAALSLAALSSAKAKARNVACLSHLRQLGIATRLYAEDNHGRLPVAEPLPSNPDRPETPRPRICDVLGPYVGKVTTTNGGTSVFKCPADNGWFFEVEGSSYRWNAALNGERIDLSESTRVQGAGSLPDGGEWRTNYTMELAPESTVLLLDYDDFHPRPPKSGKNAVYMEGHATTLGTLRPTHP
jgi:prepilin-type N-terminal cleavage/methylation domain-containing protein